MAEQDDDENDDDDDIRPHRKSLNLTSFQRPLWQSACAIFSSRPTMVICSGWSCMILTLRRLDLEIFCKAIVYNYIVCEKRLSIGCIIIIINITIIIFILDLKPRVKFMAADATRPISSEEARQAFLEVLPLRDTTGYSLPYERPDADSRRAKRLRAS
eukprot:12423844-Karenia_brevis.AAC.1